MEPIVLEKGESLVFVYGTLKQGYRNHYLLEDTTFVGKGRTPPNYLLYDCGPFPCLISTPEDEGRSIEGEVYKVNQKVVAALDKLEGVPHLYQRKTTKVNLSGGKEPVTASVYIFNRTVEKFLDCGVSWPRS